LIAQAGLDGCGKAAAGTQRSQAVVHDCFTVIDIRDDTTANRIFRVRDRALRRGAHHRDRLQISSSENGPDLDVACGCHQ
jgi:hypothetical protein